MIFTVSGTDAPQLPLPSNESANQGTWQEHTVTCSSHWLSKLRLASVSIITVVVAFSALIVPFDGLAEGGVALMLAGGAGVLGIQYHRFSAAMGLELDAEMVAFSTSHVIFCDLLHSALDERCCYLQFDPRDPSGLIEQNN